MISPTLDLVLAGYGIAGLIFLLAVSIYEEKWFPSGVKMPFWGFVFSNLWIVIAWPVLLATELWETGNMLESVSVFLTKRISFKKKQTPDIESRK